MKTIKRRRLEPLPPLNCGECKYYQPVHDITSKLSEGWCRVDEAGANLVLSEETCNKWEAK